MTKYTILLACEADAERAFLYDNLAADGYEVLVAANRAEATRELWRRPHLVLAHLHGETTLSLLDAVRGSAGLASQVDPDVPFVALVASASELQRVRYLERRCDDVLEKPVAYTELRARVALRLWRAYGDDRRADEPCWLREGRRRTADGVLRAGALQIDLNARTVTVGERPVSASKTEFALLTVLAGEPERAFTRAELLRQVWGLGAEARTRTLDSHAGRLRRKLSAAGAPGLVQNLWGVGYRLGVERPGRPQLEAVAA